MKLSNGFTNLAASILTFVFWGISFTIFIFALKHFDLSFIYAIWAGLGILQVSIIGMACFKEPVITREKPQPTFPRQPTFTSKSSMI